MLRMTFFSFRKKRRFLRDDFSLKSLNYISVYVKKIFLYILFRFYFIITFFFHHWKIFRISDTVEATDRSFPILGIYKWYAYVFLLIGFLVCYQISECVLIYVRKIAKWIQEYLPKFFIILFRNLFIILRLLIVSSLIVFSSFVWFCTFLFFIVKFI